jgi:hypothetical protein
MVTLDRELGGNNLKRAQDRGARDNHDEVQSKAQEGEAFWKVGAWAVTREEEVAEGSEAQNAICDGNELRGEKTGSEVKQPWFPSLGRGEEDTERVSWGKVREFIGRSHRTGNDLQSFALLAWLTNMTYR